MASFTIVGVDPSSKRSAVCCGGRVTAIDSRALKDHLVAVSQGVKARGEGLIVLWDSPLSFARAAGYSSRSVDLAVSRTIKEDPRIESGAANVLHFTGVTHWALTLDLLGLWIDGDRQGPSWADARLQLVDRREDLSKSAINVVEVHPTVALCAWWLEKSAQSFKRYKPGGSLSKATRLSRCESLWRVVGIGRRPCFETQGLKPDDVLDAWAAWKLGCDWLQGKAELVGSAQQGGYLLPKGGFVDAVKARLED